MAKTYSNSSAWGLPALTGINAGNALRTPKPAIVCVSQAYGAKAPTR
jgi:hypothetical protein